MTALAPYLPPRHAWRLLAASGAVACAALLFVYAGLLSTHVRVGAEAQTVATQIAADKPLLRRWLRTGRAGPAEEAAKPPDPQAFLLSVETALRQPGLQVTRLAPAASTSNLLALEVAAPWDKLLGLFSAVEALGGQPIGVAVQPTPEGMLRASFSLSPTGSPAAATAPPTLPNPFALPEPPVDLSQYHLTAVTRFGTTAMVTINGRDYLAGETLDALTIGPISEAAVQLEWPGGAAPLRLPDRDGVR